MPWFARPTCAVLLACYAPAVWSRTSSAPLRTAAPSQCAIRPLGTYFTVSSLSSYSVSCSNLSLCAPRALLAATSSCLSSAAPGSAASRHCAALPLSIYQGHASACPLPWGLVPLPPCLATPEACAPCSSCESCPPHCMLISGGTLPLSSAFFLCRIHHRVPGLLDGPLSDGRLRSLRSAPDTPVHSPSLSPPFLPR